MVEREYKTIRIDANTDDVSFVSLLFFKWMNNVFQKGSKRPLDVNDFLPLAKESSTCSLIEQLKTKWNEEKTKWKGSGKKPKLWKSVLKMISVKELVVLVLTGALFSLYCLLQPLLLGYLVVSLMSAGSQKNYLLYGCALAMGINALIGSFSNHQFNYRCELLGIRVSSALKGLVYLKVKKKSRKIACIVQLRTGLCNLPFRVRVRIRYASSLHHVEISNIVLHSLRSWRKINQNTRKSCFIFTRW